MKKGKKNTKKTELNNAIKWIKAGNKIVWLRKEFKPHIERLLNIKLKHLTDIKYLVLDK